MKIDRETLTRTIEKKETEEFLALYPELRAWLRIKGIKTQHHYVRFLMRYLKTLEQNGIAKTPKDLYDLAKEENGEYGTRHVETLEEFQIACEDVFPENERSIIFRVSVAIKSFYSFKGKLYQFPKDRGEYEYEHKKAKITPKLEDIIPYIDTFPHLRNKMIVALETSAPFRLESLTMLKWKHFREVLENKELPHVFLVSKEMKGKGKRGYKGIEQHCFLSPFAKDYVLRWKEEYERIANTRIDINVPESLEQPFLISYKGETKGKQLSYSGLNLTFDRARTERFPFSIHRWRTFSNEALKKANVLKEDREIIRGDKPDVIEQAYSDLNIERLRKEFRRAVPYLDPTYREDERVKKLQEKIRKLKNVEVSEEQAKEILDDLMMKFFKGSD